MRYARWIFGMMLSASLPLGCDLLIGISDFPDEGSTETGGSMGGGGPDRCAEINGCRKADIAGSVFDFSDSGISPGININEIDAGISISGPCLIVGSNEIQIDITSPTCSLHGGAVVGNVATPDEAAVNPIEALIRADAASPLKFKVSGCVVPFYCEGDPSIRGAVFSK